MTTPTPQERADYIVRKLEQFIREGKSERGMSFKTWQAMARAELANAFADIEQRQAQRRADLTVRRILIIGATSLVTIGFWGAVMAVDRRYGPVAALLLSIAGLVVAAMALEFGLRHAMNRIKLQRRKTAFGRIEDFDRQLKRLEAEIWRQVEQAKAKAADPP
ncbi:MAG: hypothetical protein WDN69_08705 [Aliidongia sp.]